MIVKKAFPIFKVSYDIVYEDPEAVGMNWLKEVRKEFLSYQFVGDRTNFILKIRNQYKNENFEFDKAHNQRLLDSLNEVTIKEEYVKIKKTNFINFLIKLGLIEQ